MSFHLSEWSIKKPVPTILAFMIMAIAGFVCFSNLGINDQPNIDVSLVNITVSQQGAGPAELESQVTKKIEDAVAGLGNIDKLTSVITNETSVTTIEFDLGTNSDRATNDVRNAVAQIRQDLPEDVNEPIVKRLTFSGGAILTYAVSSPQRSVEELSDIVDRRISRELLNVPGVAQVNRLGGVDREIRIELDPERLLAYGITATQVNNQVRASNLNLSGGRAQLGGREQNIRTLGSAETVEDLRNYRIILPGGDSVPLRNLGKVTDEFAEPRNSALLNGEPVVAFSVRRSTGSTLVTVEEGIQKAVKNLDKILPEDIQLKLIFTRADRIRNTYISTLQALGFGCILTVLTVGIFLRDWRVTFITGLALPLSIIPTFIVMQYLNYTLNGMTLLALALAIGNLVDDAICMIENIDQHLQMGKTPWRAALDGAKEIGLAVVATTATIVAVFMPVAFMGGITGQFFQPFGVTVSVSTMFSTLVATTMTPMLSAYLLQPKYKQTTNNKQQTTNNKQQTTNNQQPTTKIKPYRSLLTWALRHRVITIMMAIAFFIGSLQLVPYIPKGLFSNGDYGLSLVTVELPPGSTLKETEAVMKQTTQLLRANPVVESVLATADKINEGLIYTRLVPAEERDITQRQFEENIRPQLRQIPGARIAFRAQGGGGGDKDLSLILKSENPELLARTADALEKQMRSVPGLVEVSSSLSLVKPEIAIIPKIERAADLGVSIRDIGRTASLALLGDFQSNLAKFNLPDRQIPIRVLLDPDRPQDMETLKNLRVLSNDGSLVPLSAVADFRLISGPAEIKRFNRYRQVSLGANLEGISLGEALEKVNALPAMQSLPPEVSQEPAGEAEIMREVFTRFGSALGLAILCIYGILVVLYNNFLYPFCILAALPLSVGGALLGLLITQKEMGLFALIGIVLLMGLVTKNAILLVDFTLDAQRKGQPQFKAIVEAGVSRLRPILMTSISTIAGMMPIALEWGADGAVRSPMAIAVIGGFTTSTLLTLVVVPVLFTYVDNFSHWLGKLLGGRRKEEPSGLTFEPQDKVMQME